MGPDDTGGLTLKFGAGFEAPWYRAAGAPKSVAAQLAEFAGLAKEETEGKSPFEIALAANAKIQLAYASQVVETGLGATQERKPSGNFRGKASRPNVPAAGSKPSTSEPADDDPNAGILAAIEAAEDTDKLKEVYVRNVKVFEQEQKDGESALRDAFKARRDALKG